MLHIYVYNSHAQHPNKAQAFIYTEPSTLKNLVNLAGPLIGYSKKELTGTFKKVQIMPAIITLSTTYNTRYSFTSIF